MITTRSTISFLPALLLASALLLTSCQDQPLDNGEGGTLHLDTTVVTRIDTVVLGNLDTVFIRTVDTTFVDRIDTVKVTVRDTIVDTVIRVRVDTIEVPREIIRTRKARLRYFGQDRANGTNAPIDSFFVDISEWINYRVIDSAGELRGIGVTLSTALPVRFRTVDIGLGRSTIPYALQGVALYVPLLRAGNGGVFGDTIGLNHHPFALPTNGDRAGGMMISVRDFEKSELINLVTGGVVEVDGQPGSDRFVNRGVFRIREIDRKERVLYGVIEATFYIEEDDLRGSVVPVDVRIDLELGW